MLSGSAPRLRVDPFGIAPDGRTVEIHTLSNATGMEVCFLSLGGIIVSVKVPDRDGVHVDVTPGYDTLDDYLADADYFGALIGRYANRIAGGRFSLDGTDHTLTPNDGTNLLHGGTHGFHRALWTVDTFARDCSVGAVLTYTSPSGEEGFPGTLSVRVTYTLTDTNELWFDYAATTDAATPVNLTQHLYFNLAGHAAGDILDHQLTLFASCYLPVNDQIIPTGQLCPVEGTPFDFRHERTIGAEMHPRDALLPIDGYDHSFVLDDNEATTTRVAARLYEPASGRQLEIETTEPGLQFYSGDQLGNGTSGKNGRPYVRHGALALETQHFPNSPNEPSFPSTILRPGEKYASRTVYRFLTRGLSSEKT
ncbi:MAG: aldose epimerase family protein [Gemmatimonadaceae bacterium]